jgi:non-specific serine/threonine protein kinase
VGRTNEAATVAALLCRADVRLLALTGIGGVGKTRLALEAARQAAGCFPGGVWFVDLAPVTSPDLALTMVSQSMGITLQAGESPLEELASTLATVQGLLLLDNVDGVLEAAPDIVALLARCPELHVLVTSRARLSVYGEVTYSVPPLNVGDESGALTLSELESIDAIALFVSRARAVAPDFALTRDNAEPVAAICRRLDGLPLAIELAAARIDLVPPPMMLSRLERRLPLPQAPGPDRDGRQRTIAGALAWSHDLLSEEAQTVFRRLGVFAGGFTLDAADVVAGSPALEGLTVLVDRSLVSPAHAQQSEPRFSMLETVREFALDRLQESSEEGEIHARHLDHFLALAGRAEEGLTGADQTVWLDRLEADHDNLRAALSWAVATGETERSLRLAGALGTFWAWRGHLTEGSTWLDRALAMPGDASARARAKVSHRLAVLAVYLGDYERAAEMFEAARVQYDETGDSLGLANALTGLGIVAADRGDFEAAERRHREALQTRRSLGDMSAQALSLYNLGTIAAASGKFAEAREFHSQALTIRQELGGLDGIAFSTLALGEAASGEGDTRAGALLERALALFRKAGDRSGIGYALMTLGQHARQSGDNARAASFLREGLALQFELRDRPAMIQCLEHIASLVAGAGSAEAATRLAGAASAARSWLGTPASPAEAARIDPVLAETRSALGVPAYSAAWKAGESLTLPDAASLAMDLTTDLVASSATAAEPAAGFDLTPRERDVLRLLVEGHSDREIADALFMAPRTVSWHVGHILAKLDVESRTAATAAALRKGLI